MRKSGPGINDLFLYSYYWGSYEQSLVVPEKLLSGKQQNAVALGNSLVGIYIAVWMWHSRMLKNSMHA